MNRRDKVQGKKAEASASAARKGAPSPRRRFPAEAYDYGGDILPDDVNRLRKRAKPLLEGEWEVIEGHGKAK
jgi:hypothetical protein